MLALLHWDPRHSFRGSTGSSSSQTGCRGTHRSSAGDGSCLPSWCSCGPLADSILTPPQSSRLWSRTQAAAPNPRNGPAALRTACPRSLQVTKANSKAGSFSAPALGKEGKGAFSMRNHISKIFSINLQIQGHSLTVSVQVGHPTSTWELQGLSHLQKTSRGSLRETEPTAPLGSSFCGVILTTFLS